LTATLPATTETGPALAIPRVFHRIWLGGPLPEREGRYGETWAEHHPDWELRLWHDGNLPPLVNQEQFDAAGSPAQKADILRYELLLAHGGIYVDTDFECFRSIEPLLAGVRAFCGREDANRVTNSILGSVPGHPFFAAVVAALPDSVAWRPGRPPNEQTGPELLSRVLIEREALGREVPTVFGPELFFPYLWTEPHRAGEHFPRAYAAHHWAKSWDGTTGISGGTSKEPTVNATARGDVVRVVVEIDPDRFTEAGAVVLASALQAAGAVAGAELALVVRGVAQVTPELREALSSIVTTVAPASSLPEITIYGEPDGQALDAALRVLVTDDPASAASAVLALGKWSTGDSGATAAAGTAAPAAPAMPAATPAPPAAPAPAAHAAVYVGGGRLLVRTAWGDKLYCDAADLSLTPDLALTGVFDPPLCAFISRWLRPGDTAVDVGANIGALTVLMARTVGHTGRVLAFEANPHTAALLRDNVSVNYRNDWVEIREQAAWSEQARLTFHISHRFQGNGSLLAHDDWYAGHFRVDTHDQVEVDAVPLDPTLRELSPRLVKIDVEGAEPDVLAGMSGWLGEARDTAIAVEVVRNRMGDRWATFTEQLRWLVGAGWQPMLLEPDGTPRPVELTTVLEVGWFDNVLLMR
jgi:FkbM family methyltransferase